MFVEKESLLSYGILSFEQEFTYRGVSSPQNKEINFRKRGMIWR